MNIHPTAIVAKGAQIGQGVTIAPRAFIGDNVTIAENCEIGMGAYLDGWTTIGPRCRIFPYAVVGTPPQDLKFGGEKTLLQIGSDTVIREYVTINRGTSHGGGITKIGNNNFIMAYVHIAHDCLIGDYNIFANAATLAGHIIVEDRVSIGGLTGIHQFVQLGSYAFIGGCSAVSQDILPFALATGNHAQIHGLNVIGLQRNNFSTERIHNLKKAYRILFNTQLTKSQALNQLQESFEQNQDIEHLLAFTSKSQRGYAKRVKLKT